MPLPSDLKKYGTEGNGRRYHYADFTPQSPHMLIQRRVPLDQGRSFGTSAIKVVQRADGGNNISAEVILRFPKEATNAEVLAVVDDLQNVVDDPAFKNAIGNTLFIKD